MFAKVPAEILKRTSEESPEKIMRNSDAYVSNTGRNLLREIPEESPREILGM